MTANVYTYYIYIFTINTGCHLELSSKWRPKRDMCKFQHWSSESSRPKDFQNCKELHVV